MANGEALGDNLFSDKMTPCEAREGAKDVWWHASEAASIRQQIVGLTMVMMEAESNALHGAVNLLENNNWKMIGNYATWEDFCHGEYGELAPFLIETVDNYLATRLIPQEYKIAGKPQIAALNKIPDDRKVEVVKEAYRVASRNPRTGNKQMSGRLIEETAKKLGVAMVDDGRVKVQKKGQSIPDRVKVEKLVTALKNMQLAAEAVCLSASLGDYEPSNRLVAGLPSSIDELLRSIGEAV